jgi:hypothetical protein
VGAPADSIEEARATLGAVEQALRAAWSRETSVDPGILVPRQISNALAPTSTVTVVNPNPDIERAARRALGARIALRIVPASLPPAPA